MTVHLYKSKECATTRVNTNVDYGISVIMMYQCRFINCNKCVILVKDVDNGGGFVCLRAGGI